MFASVQFSRRWMCQVVGGAPVGLASSLQCCYWPIAIGSVLLAAGNGLHSYKQERQLSQTDAVFTKLVDFRDNFFQLEITLKRVLLCRCADHHWPQCKARRWSRSVSNKPCRPSMTRHQHSSIHTVHYGHRHAKHKNHQISIPDLYFRLQFYGKA